MTAQTPEYVIGGKRMEDAHGWWTTHERTLVALADGHGSTEVADGVWLGGREAADAAIGACEVLMAPQRNGNPVASAKHFLDEAFRSAHDAASAVRFGLHRARLTGSVDVMHQNGQWKLARHGTTLCIVHVAPDGVATVAYTGDSMALVVPARGDGDATFAGQPHTTRNAAERRRVLRVGGRVDGRYFRVMDGDEPFFLQVSRAVGHKGRPAISPIPEVVEVGAGWDALILGSDGVWDFVTPAEAEAIVRAAPDSRRAAKNILIAAHDVAIRQGRKRDNATVAVIMRLRGLAAAPRGSGLVCRAVNQR